MSEQPISEVLVQMVAVVMQQAHREWRKTEKDTSIVADFRELARAALVVARKMKVDL